MIFEKYDGITQHHATRLGCVPGVFAHTGTTIVPDADMARRKRVIVNETQAHTVIQTPPELAAVLLAGLDLSQAVSAATVQHTLAATHAKRQWLDYVFHPPAGWVPPDADPRTRLLTEQDDAALAALNARLSENDRNLGGVSAEDPVRVGLFEGARCIAAASFLFYGEHIADVGVITDPEFRGRGLGKTVVTGLLHQRGNRAGQYRTQHTNIGSHSLARSLGLVLFLTETGLAVEA
jgi:GNAT superfamily N-acetyltransferase